MVEYREVTDANAWDEIVNAHAGHPMQAWGWGELKTRTGSWTARRIVVERDGAFEGACQEASLAVRAYLLCPAWSCGRPSSRCSPAC